MSETNSSGDNPSAVRAAFEKGRSSGADLIASRNRRVLAGRPVAQGLVVAAGDSWFDYAGGDVLSAMRDLGFDVEATARAGDTLEEMAFSPRHLGDVHRALARVKASGLVPKAIVLSGGSHDLSGDEFGAAVNHAASGMPPVNTDVIAGVVDGRLKVALSHWIGAIDAVARGVFGVPLKIIVHGYDYPVPDGRAYAFGPVHLRGPWLRPGFWLKGHTNLQRNRAAVREIVDRFNDMQEKLIAELRLPNLVHVDLRNTLSSVLYENDWENELHPTEAGFQALARRLASSVG